MTPAYHPPVLVVEDEMFIRVVAVDFREVDGRFISFHAKKARGMMARWMVEHHVTDIDAMKGFDTDGYRFDAGASDDARWTFGRTA